MRFRHILFMSLALWFWMNVPSQAQMEDSTIMGKTLAQWMQEAQHPDPGVREKAIQTLQLFGPAAQKAGAILIGNLSNPDAGLRVNAAIAIGHIGLNDWDKEKGIGGLMTMLNDSQAIARFQAAMALGRIGPDAKAAIPRLAQYTIRDRGSWEIRKAAAFALGAIGVDKEKGADSRALAALTSVAVGQYRDPCAQVRLEAVLAISILAQALNPNDLEPLLRTMQGSVSDPDKTVSMYGRLFLLQLSNKAVVNDTTLSPISKMLKDPNVEVRVHAARILALVGEQAQSQIEPLIEALEDKEFMVAGTAAMALGEMKNGFTDRHVAMLCLMLKHPQAYVRSNAAQTLGLIGPKAKSRLADLIDALRDPDDSVLMAVVFALGEIGPEAMPAVPMLTEVTKHKEAFVAQAARNALDKIHKRN
ncbi:MAG: HEAT repeat domain-containing protein [Gemmataceae bacterium]